MARLQSGRHAVAARVAFAVAACLAGPVVHAEAPPLPSSRFGSVTIAGAPAPAGTEIAAWFAGAPIAAAASFSLDGEGRYRLDVPGDRAETPEVEGPSEGQSFEIRVGGAPALSTAWSEGIYALLDLTAAAGADLAVTIDDGLTAIAAGATATYTITVTNAGPGEATGCALIVTLPLGATFAAASDGGAVSGDQVVWPLFSTGAGSPVERTLTLAVAGTLPAGLDLLPVAAQVAHDGAAGADPEPANDQATDENQLVAAPDLTVTIDDGAAEVRPGATQVYRLTLTNGGTQGATGVAVSALLPAGVELYSASHGGTFAGASVDWPAFALPAGATLERAVTVRVPADLDSGVTSLEAEAAVGDDGANGADENPADNLATDVDAVFHAPNLGVPGVDTTPATTDPETLEISGTVVVTIVNDGTVDAAVHEVVAFSDLDGDGLFTADADLVLGAGIAPPLARGASAPFVVPVAGTVRFRGDRIFAMADAQQAIPELDETDNVGDSSAACAVSPSAAPFVPVVERHWPLPGVPIYQPAAIDSLSTPIVVQLTDDNGDGLWDERDVPDLVFVTVDITYLLEPKVVLRAIRGDSGAAIFDVDGFFPHPTAPQLFSFSGLAAGDIDHDGKPEILTTTFSPAPVNVVRAYEHTGALKWVSQTYHTHPSPVGLSNRDNPALADLDGDGWTEILVGANVFNRFGQRLWRGAGGQAFQSSGNSGDRGGAISVAADVDLDGRREVVTGNTLYRYDGEIAWQAALPDGYPAVANFDADPQAEIVVVAAGSVRLHDTDGTLLWGPVELPGSDPEAGGAPTVGDFDGDGQPEIGVAGSDVYVVFEPDGAIRWQASTQDYSSNLTGSTSFDFDGDGALEIVYRDERRLRVFRGTDGVVLFEHVMSSNTWTEEPVVVDVDRDGAAEIVVSSDRAPDIALPAGGRTAGIFVLGDGGDGWVPARGLWNQHAYTPGEVGDDASLPAWPDWGWLDHGSFRANVPPVAGSPASSDLTASRLLVDLSGLPQVHATVRVGNGGRAAAGGALSVALYDGDPGAGGALLGVVATGEPLSPGGHVDLELAFPLPNPASGLLVAVADDDGTGVGRERECDETNNAVSTGFDVTALGLWLTVDDGTTSVGAGDHVTYTIAIQNAFAGTANGVEVTDLLPEHTLFVAASDGGIETAGMVAWPLFALAPGATAVRTVTVQVDPGLPLGVTAIVDTASVTYDGALGPDPTPGNNVATDVDTVTPVTADAGGPYAGDEGDPIPLDGSGSFDRDGTIVAYAWDLDDDGAFDDASTVAVSHAFPGDGLFTVRLRVTDDSGESDTDAATVNVGNAPPVVSAPPDLAGAEGAPVSLAAVTVADPGDAVTVTVDWGDGTVESVAVVGGALTGSHVYSDDGSFLVGICASDDVAPPVCLDVPATIANAAPAVAPHLDFDFSGWIAEELGGGSTTLWDLAADARSVVEHRNGEPSLFVGDFPAFGNYEVGVRIADSWDDDFVGLALGVAPGDLANPAADFLLIDWKGGHQDGARRGLALSRVHGVPTSGELLLHTDLAANGAANRVEELARAATRGDAGWQRHRDYRLRVEYTAGRLRLWVDDTLELDVAGSFPAGALGLYDFSQANTIFTAIDSELLVAGAEGSPAALRAAFADPGIADTHSAIAAWGDGAAGPVELSEEEGQGEIADAHVYVEDGEYTVDLCVTDDDGGTACAALPARISNMPPSLALTVVPGAYRQDPVTLGGTSFTDPGVLDLHTATVDWGDGAIEPATVSETNGSGTIARSHLYAVEGTYTVEVCVADDDGGVACDAREVTLVERRVDLSVTKSANAAVARPGQRVTYTLVARNPGTVPAAGVVLTDQLPPHVVFVSASHVWTLADGTVTWNIGTLSPGATRNRAIVVDVVPDPPFGVTVENHAHITDNGAAGPDADPANNEAVVSLQLTDAVSPIVNLPAFAPVTERATRTLGSARYADTTAGEAHTGAVDWGDGATSVPTLDPAAGTSGSIAASHVYEDDGTYDVEVCVTDAAGNTGCSNRPARVDNSPPLVIEVGAANLRSWREEEYESSDPSARWVVAVDGLSVQQTINSQPSVFVSPMPAQGMALAGSIRVGSSGSWDDDFVGYVLGYRLGDNLNPEAEFLLLDWKQGDQGSARRGLALSRVEGVASSGELWAHTDVPENGSTNRVVELARALTLGDTGWIDQREYHFRFESTADRLRIWVDDVLQFDVEGPFPVGKFGFYNYSQEDVHYRGFTLGMAEQFEGQTFELEAPFTDPGFADTHTGTIDWDDGASGPADAVATQGFGYVSADHAFPDDGDYSIEACVEDDDGGADCGLFPLLVYNLPPEVEASEGLVAVAGVLATFELASFTDPGALDHHVAQVEWGDGATGPGDVIEDRGAGTVSAGRVYASPGQYPVSICVADDDGGEGCASTSILVLDAPPDVRASKTVTEIDRDGDGQVSPGDDLVYRIVVSNSGTTPATGVSLTDPIPAHTAIVAGSVQPQLLATSEDPVVVEIGALGPGESIDVLFAVTIAPVLPAGVREIVNSGTLASLEAPPIPTDDPALPGPADPTRIGVVAAPGLALDKSATVLDLDADGVAGPGDEIEWQLTLAASGTTSATGVVLADPVPEHVALLPDSIVASAGEIAGLDPLLLTLDRVAPGETVTLTFRTAIDLELPDDVEEVVNQASLLANEVEGLLSDDPGTPAPADPTRVPVYVLPHLSVAAVSLFEGNAGQTPVVFELLLDRPARLAAAVEWQLVAGEALPGEDYLAASGVAQFAAGEDRALVAVAALGDTLVELDESFTLALASPELLHLDVTEAAATLVNDDATAIETPDVELPEGESGALILALTAPSALPIDVAWATADGSATAGADYVAGAGVVTFPPLTTSAAIPLATLGDALPELTETFTVSLATSGVAGLPDPTAEVLVLDDDPTFLAVGDVAIEEGDAGTTVAHLPITLTVAHTVEVTVAWQTVPGTAAPGEDYESATGTASFAPGTTLVELPLEIVGEEVIESDETFTVELSAPAHAQVEDGVALVTILDDDTPTCTLTCPEDLTRPNDAGLCGAVLELPSPVAGGDCGEVACVPASGSPFAVGTTEVTCSAATVPVACTFAVTVTDVEGPSVTVPNLEVGTDPGLCSAEVSVATEVTDNCPGAQSATCTPAGVPFALGTTAVTCSALDAAGNSGSGTGAVTVLDVEPPAIDSCPADLRLEIPPGALSWPAHWSDPGGTDNCPEVAVACDPVSGDPFPPGSTTVVCSAVDGAGLSDSCDFNVTLVPQAIAEIPTLDRGALAALALFVALAALATLRRIGGGS